MPVLVLVSVAPLCAKPVSHRCCTASNGILDRLAHNAHRIEMRGESMRKKRNLPQDEKQQ